MRVFCSVPSWLRALIPLVVVFVPVALVYLSGGLEFVERRWMEARFRFAARPAMSDVVVVDIDPRSLNVLGTWPWPRGYHATVLEVLLDAGARRVGFDVDFSLRTRQEEDDQLAHAIRNAKNRVVLPVFSQWQRNGPGDYSLVAVRPLPALEKNASLGSINVEPDPDGLVRRYRLSREGSDRLYGSFAVSLMGETPAAPDPFYVDFSVDPESFPRLSYVDVLMNRFSPSQIAGKTVIVGSTAVELGDQIAVPVSAVVPGPLLQALAYESLTTGRALERASPWISLFVALLLIAAMAPVFRAATWQASLLLAVLLAAVGMAFALLAQTDLGWIVDSTPWALSLVGLYAYGLIYRVDQQNLRLLLQKLALDRTENLMQHVVEHSFDAIITLDADGRIETANRAARDMFRCEEEELAGREASRLFMGDTCAPEFRSPIEEAERQLVEAMARRANGAPFPVELVKTEIPDAEDFHSVLFIRDITERREQQERLRHQATHDPLTNLPNRLLLRHRVESALDHAQEHGCGVAILLLDLDRFKEINDALGHHVGDQILQEVSLRLRKPIPPSGTLARLGGDEFAVLLPRCGMHEARELGEKLIEALRVPFITDGLTLQIDTSIGVTLFPYHGSDAESLLRRADVAMYQAKRNGQGLEVYDPDEDMTDLRHLTLRGKLRAAIEDEELDLVFQPKIRTDGRVVGVEALLRWNHPEHGSIPPEEFIGMAEHGGLIRQLTRWVCETALKQAAEWRSRGLGLNVSVNLSARNLLEEDLPEALSELLDASDMPPEMLTLEITESVIMEDPELAMRVVTRLRELGVGISIDDFGTGYSSLGYLMKLPAQELKIDRSFVMQMESDPGSATIVHSTIDLAHNLGLRVVAEGVENEVVWKILRDLGCDLGQGYHFSRPLPPRELEAHLRDSGLEVAKVDVDQETAGRIDPALLVADTLVETEQPPV